MDVKTEAAIVDLRSSGQEALTLARRLRAARLEQKRTQAQLAKAAGISRTTLNQLESGLVIDLSVQRLRAVLREVDQAMKQRRR